MDDSTVDFPDKLEQYFRPSPEDGWYLAVMSAIIVLVWTQTGEMAPSIAAVIAMGVGYIQLDAGRVWFVLTVVGPAGWWTDRIQKGWLSNANPKRPRLFRLLRRVRSPMEDIEIHLIHEDLAVAYNRRERTDTVYIVGDGNDIAMTHLAFQASDNKRLEDMVKHLALVREVELGLEWVTSYRPSDVRETIDVLLDNLIAEVLPPAEVESEEIEVSEHIEFGWEEQGDEEESPSSTDDLESDEEDAGRPILPTLEELAEMTQEERDDICYANVGRNYEEILKIVRDEASMATMALAITIKRDANLAKQFKEQAAARDARGVRKILKQIFRARFRQQSMAEDKDESLLVEEIVNVAIEGLELSGVEMPRPMDARRMHAHFRYAWDVQQDDEYAEWANSDPPLSDPRFGDFHLPQYYERVKDGVLEIDGNYAAVLRSVGNPREADPFTFRPLFAINVPNLTVATITRAIASNQEVDLLEARQAGGMALSEEFGVWYQKQSALERQERMQHQLESIYAAKYRVRMNIVVVILATDRTLLKEYVKNTIQEIHAIDGMRVKRVTNSFLLPRWFWAANGVPC